MELSSVFSKTAKGQDEISTRAHRLPARVRAMLIMIDGQRTGQQLLALCTSSAEGQRHLAQLLNGGFVQQLSATTGAALSAALPDEDISLAKSYVIRTLHELLGEGGARSGSKNRENGDARRTAAALRSTPPGARRGP
jgi:hypothetical protein